MLLFKMYIAVIIIIANDDTSHDVEEEEGILFKDDNKTVDEKIAELRKILMDGEPVFEMSPDGHLLSRCDNCHAMVEEVYGADETGSFFRCPNCGKTNRLKPVLMAYDEF